MKESESKMLAEINAFLKEHAYKIAETAMQGYKEKGRGHVMLFCADAPGTPYKKGSVSYISQAEDAKLAGGDAELRRRVRTYDPQREAVIQAYHGTQYDIITMSGIPSASGRN